MDITIGKISYNLEDLLGERGRFGIVFKGKYDGLLDVAVKRVEKSLTQIEETKFYFNVNGHQNIVNYFCTEVSDLDFM